MNLKALKDKLLSPFVAIITILGALVLLYRNRNIDLKSALLLSKAGVKDEVTEALKQELANKQTGIQQDRETARKALQEARASAKAVKADGVEDFYKKRQGE